MIVRRAILAAGAAFAAGPALASMLIYLLMALGRPDVWPDGDLALAIAMRRAKGLAVAPDAVAQRSIAEAWRPWRAVAARMLWQAYLAGER